MILDEHNPSALPARVRPLTFETPQSYLPRLLEANGMPPSAWRRILYAHIRDVQVSRHEAIETMLETLGGLRSGHFAHQRSLLPAHKDGSVCDRCRTGLSDRFACTSCSAGAVVAQYAHDDPRVCSRHLRWVGPGTLPDKQFTVSPDIAASDSLYRDLRRWGVLDAHRLAEIDESVERWATSELSEQLGPEVRYQLALQIAAAVLRDARSSAPKPISFAQRYDAMSARISEIVGGRPSTVLTDLVWLLLRASDPDDPHRFASLPGPDTLGEHEDQLRSCAYPREAHRHLTRFRYSPRAAARITLLRPGFKAEYVCARGHVFASSPNHLKTASTRVDNDGCGVCASKYPLAGFNTVADRMPEVAAGWHPTLNGALRPDQVVAGSKRSVFWLCPQGHTYEAVIFNRRRTGCPICSNRLVVPGINSLRSTHPELVGEWHPTKNLPRTPDNLVAGSNHLIWWVCPEGHEYRLIPAQRARGFGCHYCSRQKVHPTTSLAATHPTLAKQWHPVLNGDLTPSDRLSGSGTKAWWLCEKGHAFDAVIASRVKGHGCRFCSNYAATAENSLAVTHPELAAEFHPTKNTPLGPRDVLAGTSRNLWWRCARGHEWQATGSNRVRGKSCSYCTGRRAWPGWSDLATRCPDLAAEWHPHRNSLSPTAVVPGSSIVAWWQCVKGHEWQMQVDLRSRFRRECPMCRAARGDL